MIFDMNVINSIQNTYVNKQVWVKDNVELTVVCFVENPATSTSLCAM